MDSNLFEIVDPDSSITMIDVLTSSLTSGQTVTLDGALFPMKTCESLKAKLEEKGIKLEVNTESRPLFDSD